MTGNLFPARLRASHEEKRQNNNYRRNGKLQACEPCRKGKLRCDHMVPTCGRCSRLNKSDKCVYHPAPMTNFTSMPTPNSPVSEQNSLSTNSFGTLSPSRNERTASQAPASGFTSFVDREGSNGPVLANHGARRADSAAPQASFTFAQAIDEIFKPLPDHRLRADALSFDKHSGFTNNLALLAENEMDVGISDSSLDMDITPITPLQIDRGAAVLTVMKDLPTIHKYIKKWYSFAGGIVVIEPMVQIFIEGLIATWTRTLDSEKTPDLRLMSEKIWQNTSRPVSQLMNRNTKPREFCASVTGENLRWEIIGLIVSLVSLLAQSLRDGDPVFCVPDEAPVDRAKLALQMHNASEMCVSFCDDLGTLNDIYLWLLYENSLAYCSMRTKGSYENEKKISRLATALLSCNLHQTIKVDDNTPSFIAEIRKRLFICAYHYDKLAAASAGKPPKLLRQYCLLQIPLDLTNEQTMSDHVSTHKATEKLDERGWNEDGKIQRSTFARLAAANALILEETLEVSLGNLPQQEIARRVQEIQQKANDDWEALPQHLRLDMADPWSPQRTPMEHLVLCHIRLGHLDQHFLLQRTIDRKAEQRPLGASTSLLSICAEIYKVVILMVENNHIFRDFQIDFVSILVKHGIPAAAVLAMELLNQERNPHTQTPFPLPKSDTIQSLAVLVSCLGTVKSESSGYQTCQRGRRFFKQILDMIISGIMLGTGNSAPRTSTASCDNIDATLGLPLFEPGPDIDFVQWLDTMAYGADNWSQFT